MELVNLPVSACVLGLAIRAWRERRPAPGGPLWRWAGLSLLAATLALVPTVPGMRVRAAQVNDLPLALVQALSCPEWDPLYPAGAYAQLVLAMAWAYALAWAGVDLAFARRALRAVAAGVVLVVALGALHYHGLVDLHEGYLVPLDPNLFFRDRFQSIFWNPSWFALYFTFAFGLSLGLLWLEDGRRRLLLALALAACYGYFLLNRQRGGFLAVHAALLVLAVLWLRESRYRARWRLAALAGVVALGLALFLPLVLDPAPSSGLARALSEGGIDENRRKLWQASLDMWRSAPLFGIGESAFAVRFREFVPAGSALDLPFFGDAHNTWLQVLATRGLVGLVTWGGFVLVAVLEATRVLRGEEAGRGVGAALACGLAAFLAYSLLQGMFYLQSMRLLFWGSLALLATAASRPGGRREGRRGVRAAVAAAAVLGLVLQVRGSRPLLHEAEAEIARQPRGFYPLERRSGVPVRWSARRGTLCLYPGGSLMELRVIPGSRPPELLPVAVTVRVGERVADRFVIPTRAAVDRRIPLPEAEGFRPPAAPVPFGECLPDRIAVPLSVDVDSVWSPATAGFPEYRHLGVALVPPSYVTP